MRRLRHQARDGAIDLVPLETAHAKHGRRCRAVLEEAAIHHVLTIAQDAEELATGASVSKAR